MRRIAGLAGDASIAECPVLFWEGLFLALNVSAALSYPRHSGTELCTSQTGVVSGHFCIAQMG
jgi:hypothetical protein